MWASLCEGDVWGVVNKKLRQAGAAVSLFLPVLRRVGVETNEGWPREFCPVRQTRKTISFIFTKI